MSKSFFFEELQFATGCTDQKKLIVIADDNSPRFDFRIFIRGESLAVEADDILLEFFADVKV